ncbi:MAG: S-layer homology domain-containing protein [Clostridia bacterium]|nr:S-layer homology domain-containing protein [Clostridia bacterium]
MKKYIIAVLILIMAVSAHIYAEDSTVFTVEPSVSGGAVTVNVTYTGNVMVQGGGFNIVYDNSKLSLKSVAQGDAMANTLCVINDSFSENKIRVVWASAEAMPESGTVITMKLDMISGKFENKDISCENFEVGNANGQTIKTASMSVKGVENSIIYSGDVKEPAAEKPSTDTSSADNSQSSPSKDSGSSGVTPAAKDDRTDETLPLDKITDAGENTEEETAKVDSLGFTDVAKTDWFYNSVKYVNENKLMSGVSNTEFAPNASLTRAMLVVVLHRLEGESVGDDAHIVPQFADVESGTWYSDAVAWAASEGIVNGMGDNRFAPNADITREQIATILYKYSQMKDRVGATAVAISAPDKDKISSWAMEGMYWAVSEQLITGKDGGVLDPGGKATRAEIATILMRYIEK